MIIEIDDKKVTAKQLEQLLAWLQKQKLNPIVQGVGNGSVAIKCDIQETRNDTGPEELEDLN